MGIMEAVTNKAKRAGKALTPASLYAFFVDQCRQNLHLVIAMSPGAGKGENGMSGVEEWANVGGGGEAKCGDKTGRWGILPQTLIFLLNSAVGNAFRERLRKFPSLVNCTTIDWFSEWPADALKV